MDPKRILIVGNYGAGNLGDDAILGGILRDLESISFRGEIMVTHGGKNTSPQIYQGLTKVPFMPTGLRSRFNRKKKRIAKEAIQKVDLVILGGGGLFIDHETWKAPYIWYEQARWCRKFKTPYICYAQSVGPLKHLCSRYFAKKTYINAEDVHVRDELSKVYLQKWGVEAAHGPDSAFSYVEGLPKAKERNHQLLISIREWGSQTKETWEPILKAAEKFAKNENLHLVLFSTDPGNKEEQERLRATGHPVITPQSVEEAYLMMSEAKLMLSMRLHANIFALASKTPVVALSYSQKVKALLEGTETVILTPEDWTKENIIQSLEIATMQKPNYDPDLSINRAFLAHNLKA